MWLFSTVELQAFNPNLFAENWTVVALSGIVAVAVAVPTVPALGLIVLAGGLLWGARRHRNR